MGMFQSSLFQPVSVSVTDLTRYLRQLLENDAVLQDIWVLGEISNLSRPSSGHVYFTLKDQTSALRCVIWKTSAARLRIPLQNGMAVEAHGQISLYERDGQYQLYIDAMRPAGEGYLYQEFLRLKARLEAEGLFDAERKRPIPDRPRRIGIVTSPTGAALQDMLNTLGRRYPLAEVCVAPAAVQGDDAPAALVAAMKALCSVFQPDVILLARGGGSLEDLWAFNDEWVVRAVASMPVPVICGVGHETDVTLCDFAADLRAPTPTGAAEMCSCEIGEVVSELVDMSARLENAFLYRADGLRRELSDVTTRLSYTSPIRRVQNDRQRVDMLSLRGQRGMRHTLELARVQAQGIENRLQALNPLAVLGRGYAVVRSADGQVVRGAEQVHSGQAIEIRVARGSIDAQVTDTKPAPTSPAATGVQRP
jgi:exodeoxyribonuclease VII large subunit